MPDWAQRGRKVLGSTWLLAALLAVFTWRPLALVPRSGLSGSWELALNMATDAGLNFGSEIVFTFGPLGYLLEPQVTFAATAVTGAIYQTALTLALCFTLLWAARRSFPLPIAVALSCVAASLVVGGEELLLIVFVWSAVALSASPPGFAVPLVVYGGGITGAIALLFKLNIGISVLVICLITVAAMDAERRRNLLAFGGTLLGSLTVLWFATGQGVGNIVDYVTGSIEIASGYSEAMTSELPEASWYRTAAVLEVLAALGAASYAGLRLPRPRLVVLVGITALFCYAEFKNGLVRNDPVHTVRLYGTAMLVPWLAFRWEENAQRAIAVAVFCLITVLYFPLTGDRAGDVFAPLDRADAAGSDLRTLLDPGRRTRARDESRETLSQEYGVDPESLALLRDQGVDVHPFETSLVWAYDLDWHPQPVFQSYAAYTSELDEQDAEALSSGDGPTRIVRTLLGGFSSTAGIDGRYGPFEAPAQTVAMLCNYEPLRTTGTYQVLGRTDDRCGKPVPLGSMEAELGELILVPRPRRHSVLLATVDGLEPAGVEDVRTLVYRSAVRYVDLNGERFRLVPGTADDLGLVLRMSPGIDYPPPFGISPSAVTIAFGKQSEIFSPAGEVTVSFYSLPVRPLPNETG